MADRLRESSHDHWFTNSALLQEAADELDRLEALVERDHILIGRLEETLHEHEHDPDYPDVNPDTGDEAETL